MELTQQFVILGKKQVAIQEGIELLLQVQLELKRAQSSANTWGSVAVLANLTLIPLNVIVNAFELKKANTLYQRLVQQLYGKFASSGTRLDGHSATALSLLKQVVIDELRSKALAEYIPGVNILIGLAEDSLAAAKAIQVVESGRSEILAHTMVLERKIANARRELIRLGIKMAEILPRLEAYSRTA